LKFQVPDNSLFALLMRKPWWISFALAAAVAALAMAMLPASYRIVGVVTALPFVAIGVMALRKQWHDPGPAQIERTRETVAAMAWPALADALEASFKREGYSVKRGNGNPVDFELERQGRVTLVSARRWKSARTSVESVRALHEARDKQEAQYAVVVGLGEATDAARAFAASNSVTLWRDADLARALRGLLPKASGG
jgi:restriction system protein